jgi:hypothetical protein
MMGTHELERVAGVVVGGAAHRIPHHAFFDGDLGGYAVGRDHEQAQVTIGDDAEQPPVILVIHDGQDADIEAAHQSAGAMRGIGWQAAAGIPRHDFADIHGQPPLTA